MDFIGNTPSEQIQTIKRLPLMAGNRHATSILNRYGFAAKVNSFYKTHLHRKPINTGISIIRIMRIAN
jgi:hypothetical protein